MVFFYVSTVSVISVHTTNGISSIGVWMAFGTSGLVLFRLNAGKHNTRCTSTIIRFWPDTAADIIFKCETDEKQRLDSARGTAPASWLSLDLVCVCMCECARAKPQPDRSIRINGFGPETLVPRLNWMDPF